MPRDDLEVANLLKGAGPVVGLEVADDDVGAAFLAPPALVEHGEGLADAWRGAEVHAKRSACHRRPACYRASASSARLSCSTFTAFSPRHAQRAISRMNVHEGDDRALAEVASAGDPSCLREGVGNGDVGVETRPRCRHGIDRDLRVGGEAVEVPVGDDPVGDGVEKLRVRRSEVAAAAGGGVVAVPSRRRSRLEVPGQRMSVFVVPGLADQLGADDLAVGGDEGAVGLVVERDPADAPHRERIDDAGEDEQRDGDAEGGEELAAHVSAPPVRRAVGR